MKKAELQKNCLCAAREEKIQMCGEKMRAINLKTEYLVNPIGIDLENPRLMWNCEGGKKQTGYRIVAKADGKELWDSGKISSSSMRAEYPVPLVSRQRIEWKVMLWDENGDGGRVVRHGF